MAVRNPQAAAETVLNGHAETNGFPSNPLAAAAQRQFQLIQAQQQSFVQEVAMLVASMQSMFTPATHVAEMLSQQMGPSDYCLSYTESVQVSMEDG